MNTILLFIIRQKIVGIQYCNNIIEPKVSKLNILGLHVCLFAHGTNIIILFILIRIVIIYLLITYIKHKTYENIFLQKCFNTY